MQSVRSVSVWVVVAGVASTAWLIPPTKAQTPAAEYFVYFGTYTRAASKGIYAYRFQPAAGKLTALGLAAETPNPSFLAVHPSGRFLFAANEQEPGNAPGRNNSVSAFAIDPKTGALKFLNKVSSRGEGPCHVSIDRTGKTLLVANYGSGSVAALPILPDGRLAEATGFDQHQGTSIDPVRQTGPHAHFAAPSPDNRFVLTADLGLDQVIVYRLNPANGTLSRNSPAFAKIRGGSGPRHLAFHPNAKYVYVNSEMASTVSAFAWDTTRGTLQELQTISTLPSGFQGTSSTAEIQIDPAGRFLYVSNRGHDSIAIFSIDEATGKLTLVGHAATNGQTPRYFTFDPTGDFLFVANQNSNSVVVFRVDRKTGRITPAQTLSDVPEPVCIVFLPVSR